LDRTAVNTGGSYGLGLPGMSNSGFLKMTRQVFLFKVCFSILDLENDDRLGGIAIAIE
jgi:hypothetical protein